MKKITILLIALMMIIVGLLSGCTEQNEKNTSVNAISSDVYYSEDNETALVYCNRFSPDKIVNTIDMMYDDGYEYVGDVQTPWNYAGRIDFYLIFRK